MSGDARHVRAVAQSCRFAEEAASIGDFDEAIAWLLAVEMVDGPLSAEWEAKRAAWADQSHNGNGATRAGQPFTSPQEPAAAAGQNGGRPIGRDRAAPPADGGEPVG